MKRPHSIKNTPIVVRAKISSLNIRKSGHMLAPALGGRRDLMSRFAMTTRTRKISPITRIAQAKPMFEKSLGRRRGKMIPPTEPLVDAKPVAEPLLIRKKCPMAEIAGVKMSDVPIPPRSENVSMKCQNSSSCLISLRITKSKWMSSCIVILTRRFGHTQDTPNQTDTARENQPSRTFGIKDWPNLYSAKEGEEDVETKDPSNGALAVVR